MSRGPSDSPSDSFKRKLIKAAKWVVTAIFLWLVATKIDIPQVIEALAEISPSLYLLALLCSACIVWLQALRWKLLLRDAQIPLRKFVHFTLVGYFFAFFMPGSMTGEIFKVYLFGKRHGKMQESAGLTVLSKAAGWGMQWGLGAIGVALYWTELRSQFAFQEVSLNAGRVALVLSALLAITLICVIFWRKLRSQPWLIHLLELLRHPRLLARALFVTFAIQVFTFFNGWFVFASLGVDIPFWKFIALLAVINTILVLPISIGGVGVREYFSLVLFSSVGGIPQGTVIAANVLGYIILFGTAAVGGIWMLWRRWTFRWPRASRDGSAG